MSEKTTNPEVCSKTDFLSDFSGRRYDYVSLPNGKKMKIQSMTDLEFGEYQVAMLDKSGEFVPEKGSKSGRLLMAYCCVDEEGNRIFLSPEELANVDAGIILTMRRAIRLHCRIDEESASIEDAQKK